MLWPLAAKFSSAPWPLAVVVLEVEEAVAAAMTHRGCHR
jgi:hypothetical protein